MSRFLVTGCAGFIGSHLVEALLLADDAVVGTDCFTDYHARRTRADTKRARGDLGWEPRVLLETGHARQVESVLAREVATAPLH